MRFFLLGLLLLATTACWRQVNLPEGAAAIQVRQAEARLIEGDRDKATVAMSIYLDGAPRTLVRATSQSARRVDLQTPEATQAGGVRMRRADSFDLVEKSPLLLRHDGAHLMLVGLDRAFQAGEKVDLVLTFQDENANRQDVLVTAEIVAAGG